MLSLLARNVLICTICISSLSTLHAAPSEVYVETSKNAWLRDPVSSKYIGLKDKYSPRTYTGKGFRKNAILPVTCRGVNSEPVLKLDNAHLIASSSDFSILQGEDFTMGAWFRLAPEARGQSILMSQRSHNLAESMFSNNSSWILWVPQNGPGAMVNLFFLRQQIETPDLYKNPNYYLQTPAVPDQRQQQQAQSFVAAKIPIQQNLNSATYVVKDHFIEQTINSGSDLLGTVSGFLWGDSFSDCWVGGKRSQCWHHVAISYKAQAPSPQLFMIITRLQLNGKTESAYFPLKADSLMSSRPIQIGKTWLRIGEFTSALMKDLFIYKRAFDIKEVLEQMQSTKPDKNQLCNYDEYQEVEI